MTTSGLVLVMAFAIEFGAFASTLSSKCLAKFGENQDLAFFVGLSQTLCTMGFDLMS